MADFDDSTVVIRDVAPDVTIVSIPFAGLGNRLKTGGRATIVRLPSGALAVFSPTPLTPSVREKVATLGGKVEYLASVNVRHWLFLPQWLKEFPNAHVVVMDGLPEKLKKTPATADIEARTVFTTANKDSLTVSPEFDTEFDVEFLDSTPNGELVFFHKASKSLIEGDLIFTLPATEQFSKTKISPTSGFLMKFLVGPLLQARDLTWQRRLIWYFAKDRARVEASLKKIDQWDFDRVISCHGDVIETGGKRSFQDLAQWYLAKK